MKRHTTLLLLYCLIPYLVLAGIPEGYYNNADGKKKAALKAAMHNIIQPKKVLSYGSGESSTWSGFYQTDRTSDGYVIDRYSPRTVWVKFSSSDNANSASAPSALNIEHSFPKSWWGGSNNTAYKDLFNLMPSEKGINTTKSNFAMGKVTGNIKGNGYTKVGTGPTSSGSTSLWEPADEWKGDFARDYFYMVTTYSNLTWTSNGLDMLENNDYPTMQQWAYTLLLEWARQDPVSEIERKRNDDVYSIQKNRNPFVDFPNLAEYIWGDSVDYAFSIDGTSTGGGGGTIDPTPDFATLVDCSMKAGLDPFFVRTYEGCEGEVWTSDATYGAKANAFNISSKEADEYLMVNLDLSLATEATLTFQHATGYNGSTAVKDTYFQVLVAGNYEGVPEDASWDMLNVTFPQLKSGGGFTEFVSSGDVRLDDYCGKNITLAFRYTSNSSACYCWEIQNVKVTTHTDPDALPLIAEDIETQQVITYDLMGRRVPHDTKGLVIRNGKKILQR